MCLSQVVVGCAVRGDTVGVCASVGNELFIQFAYNAMRCLLGETYCLVGSFTKRRCDRVILCTLLGRPIRHGDIRIAIAPTVVLNPCHRVARGHPCLTRRLERDDLYRTCVIRARNRRPTRTRRGRAVASAAVTRNEHSDTHRDRNDEQQTHADQQPFDRVVLLRRRWSPRLLRRQRLLSPRPPRARLRRHRHPRTVSIRSPNVPLPKIPKKSQSNVPDTTITSVRHRSGQSRREFGHRPVPTNTS